MQTKANRKIEVNVFEKIHSKYFIYVELIHYNKIYNIKSCEYLVTVGNFFFLPSVSKGDHPLFTCTPYALWARGKVGGT